MGIAADLAALACPIGELTPLEGNPRRGDVEAVKRSLKRFGQRKPIVVSSTGVVLAGNHTLLAAKALGWDEIAVVRVGDDEATGKAFALADNRTASLGSFDTAALLEMIGEVEAFDPDLLLDASFDPDQVVELRGGKKLKGDPDAVPEAPKNPITQPGDLWILGKHRVLCGDATNPEAMKRLMDGNLADMVFTDPPWNVDYRGGTKARAALANDALEETEWSDWLTVALRNIPAEENAPAYLFFGLMRAGDTQRGVTEAGWRIVQTLVWVKQHAQFGNFRAHYKYAHEPMYYCSIGDKVPVWRGPNNETSVWNHDRAASNDYHPTQKPVEVVERALRNSSPPDAIVCDPFLGSGSTLIAAESLGRRCFGMEIEPAYCDVIATRYEQVTGDTPHLEPAYASA